MEPEAILTPPAHHGRKRLVLIVGAIVLLGVLVSAAFYWGQRSTSPTSANQSSTDTAKSALSTVQESINFPLFYPTDQRAVYQPTSLSQSDKVVTASYNVNGSTIIITQQVRPPITEEVKKSLSFSTAIGDAYIADLEGHTVGFIRNSKTLLIFSSPNNADARSLQQLMTTMRGV